MDVGWLLRGRQALRIGHGREIAVIGVTDPARARQIGAVFAGAAAANHRLAGGVDEIGFETLPGGRKALPIEFRLRLAAVDDLAMGKAGQVVLQRVLAACHSRTEITVTMLAMLELVRRRQATVEQHELFGPILLQAISGEAKP